MKNVKILKIRKLFTLIAILLMSTTGFTQNKQATPKELLNKRWKDVATNMPAEWYNSKEAKLVAENVLLSQKEIGGWEKNKPYHHTFSESEREHYINSKSEIGATFDNGATIMEMRFLARMYSHIKDDRYKQSFLKGLQYIFTAQYKNGGWPQFYPVRQGSLAYSGHITYNDDAMVNIMEFLKEIYTNDGIYTSLKISNDIKQNAREAFNNGIRCILDTQIIVNGSPTVWCAQHDSVTLAPAKARSYELPSFSGSESAGIVLLLMDIEHPSEEIKAAVNGAVEWFETNKIEGIRIETVTLDDGRKDRIVLEDENAPPHWGRFYDLESNEIFFCSRDGIKKKSMREISYERRNGYSWYTRAPEKVLTRYPDWKNQTVRKK